MRGPEPWLLPNGVYSSSGWGDGCYWCLVKLAPPEPSTASESVSRGDAHPVVDGVLTAEERELRKRKVVAVRIVFINDPRDEDKAGEVL
jgi:hypothetical protein